MGALSRWLRRTLGRAVPGGDPPIRFADRFRWFQEILARNNRVLQEMAELNSTLSGEYVFDRHSVETRVAGIVEGVERLVFALEALAPGKYRALHSVFLRIRGDIEQELSGRRSRVSTTFVMNYDGMTRDAVDDVGAKNANLAELGTVLGLRIPRGFALTASAHHAFMEHNGLAPRVREALEAWRAGGRSLEQVSAGIRKDFLEGRLPGKLTRDLREAVEGLARGRRRLVFRSSAIQEDGTQSFAGQYATELNVPPEDAAGAYRRVLASLYSENAIVYRRDRDYREHELAMPVACQEMIDAEASGVVYTLDPSGRDRRNLLIQATWGLGSALVSGETAADRYSVRRGAPWDVTSLNVVRKPTALRRDEAGGLRPVPVPPERQTTACLSTKQLRELAETALRIENHFRQPQDLEFAFDRRGRLFILQARPLRLEAQAVRARDLAPLLRGKPVLLSGRGEIAQRGIGWGPVWIVRPGSEPERVPPGSVVVAPTASPALASVLRDATALLTDVGGVTGHLATVAREMRVPALLNCGDVSSRLRPGQMVTVDAEDRVIYDGAVEELERHILAEEPIEETYEYRLLRRVLKKIEPLHLVDPSRAGFRPEACRSLHDVTRFVHEKAVEELIHADVDRAGPGRKARRLVWRIPLDLLLVDIGGGIRSGARRRVRPDEILSRPMRAFLQGLAAPGAWNSEPLSVDLRSFMSSLTRTLPPELARPRVLGRNLAVLSSAYANLSLRLGYHFTMVDAYVSERPDDNYAYFRFFGGVTETERRARRAQFVGSALGQHDFRVEIRGDLVVGRLKGLPAGELLRRLSVLGILVSFTRQLDVRMVDSDLSRFVEDFKKIVEEFHGNEDEHPDLG